ncbi:LOW QUALITY PROTEIN: hypothetical protein JCM19055_3203 [Geomicrobium sp. JCM 19055]|nr:LOW QUALITY PROTEIN: hypothetical protein JCM19055_3203 [Geomicrobium sp. JCM 19055]
MLSALVDAGANEETIISQLNTLPIDHFHMSFDNVVKMGIASKYLQLDIHDHGHAHDHNHSHEHGHDHVHRTAKDIFHLIEQSELSARVKERSIAVFTAIAHAEGTIHGMNLDDVHFHEVGAMDSIIDIIGICIALEDLNIDQIISSPVPTGSGKLHMAHGLYPIPAPATTELLKGIPLAPLEAKGELTTPTGAGILKALASSFGQVPEGIISAIGYGAGKKRLSKASKCHARVRHECPKAPERLVISQCQVDDMTGEALGFALEKLFEHEIFDAYYTPVYMKKNRPGVLITVISKPEQAQVVEHTLLKETSTLGVRQTTATRNPMKRSMETLDTPLGAINVKHASTADGIVKRSYEYEDLKRAANEHHLSLQQVIEATYDWERENSKG